MLIKIMCCSNPDFWYKNHVGKIFQAEKTRDGYVIDQIEGQKIPRRVIAQDISEIQPFWMHFMSDWSIMLTPKDSEEQFTDFKFNGPGWYISEHTLLVLPCEREAENMWHQRWREDEMFEFHVYNDRNPAEIFNLIINAPTRRNDR